MLYGQKTKLELRNGEFKVSTNLKKNHHSEKRAICDFNFDFYSPQLAVDKTIEDGVYIFPLRDTTHQPCVYDTVIFSNNVTDFQLCFSFLEAELSKL